MSKYTSRWAKCSRDLDLANAHASSRNRGRRRLITMGILQSKFWTTYRAIVRAISRSWRRWRASPAAPRKCRSIKRGDEGAASSCDNDLETAAENERVGGGREGKKNEEYLPFSKAGVRRSWTTWNAPEGPIGIVFPVTSTHTRTTFARAFLDTTLRCLRKTNDMIIIQFLMLNNTKAMPR